VAADAMNQKGGKSRLVWPGTWHERSAAMLRKDLKAAKIPYRNDQGKVFDFHALRHHFITSLVKSGVHPKEAQVLARHSTITLTMDRYAHSDIRDKQGAVERLPPVPVIPLTEPSGEGLSSAEQAGPLEFVVPYVVPTSVPSSPESAERVPEVSLGPETEQGHKPLSGSHFGTVIPGLSDGDQNSGGGTRTPDTRIMIPLL
jgi:hypothetical protein